MELGPLHQFQRTAWRTVDLKQVKTLDLRQNLVVFFAVNCYVRYIAVNG